MRVVMSFVVKKQPVPEGKRPSYRRVVTGPAFGVMRASFLFELMELRVTTIEGCLSIEQLAQGLATAKRALNLSPIAAQALEHGHTREQLAQALESLGTWATVARLQGATDLIWIEDF
jgi:hypothetical protein